MLRAISIALLVIALVPAGASAQANLSDAEVERRLEFLEQRLDDRKLHGQLWFYGWVTVMSGNGIAGIVRGSRDDSKDRRTQGFVEAGRSMLGLTDMLFRQSEVRHGANRIRAMPSATSSDRLRKLEAAEAQLKRNAERADERWNWMPHIGNLAVNLVAGGLVAGVGGDWNDAAFTFAGGLIGGEARIWTEPWGPASDLEDYESFKATGQAKVNGGFSIVPTGTGLALKYTF